MRTVEVFKDRPIVLLDLLNCDADDIIMIGESARGFLRSISDTFTDYSVGKELAMDPTPVEYIRASKHMPDLNGLPNNIGHAIGRSFFYSVEPYIVGSGSD
jgi:hypothetical protein